MEWVGQEAATQARVTGFADGSLGGEEWRRVTRKKQLEC